MQERWAVVEAASLGDGKHGVRTLEGEDGLNRLFRFRVTVERFGAGVLAQSDVLELLESPIRLTFVEDAQVLGEYGGIVVEASSVLAAEHEKADLSIEIAPRAWLLTQRHGSEIFIDQSIVDAIKSKLQGIGLEPDVDFVMALSDPYPLREFIAQYEETDYAFVSRLCEQAGIATFFEWRGDREVWIFTDASHVYHDIARTPLRVSWKREHPSAYDIKTTFRRTSAKSEVHDYNYRAPLLDLRERHPVERRAARGEWVEFGNNPKTLPEASSLARIRAHEHGARHHVVEGRADESALRAGGILTLADAGGDEQSLLVTGVTFNFRQTDEVGRAPWDNGFEAIPRDVPFRPARVTPLPKIHGLLNAVVDGAIRGEYAELDDAGRYHLRMSYDRSGRTDLGATHPVRMMQPHSGANYGMHFPLRPGIEVLVGFVNGDPDRPVIVGTAPNPITSSPVEQSNQTQNVLRTGSNNEIVIEDLKGTERVRMHTPYENTTLQLGAEQEAEEGALITTEANVSFAARESVNAATPRAVLLSDSGTALLGRRAFVAAGSDSVSKASEAGMEKPVSFSLDDVTKDLQRLAVAPEERETFLEEEALEDQSKGDQTDGESETDEAGEEDTAGLWSGLAAAVSELTRTSLNDLVRAAAHTTDVGLDDAKGRSQGQPLAEPQEPATISAADQTAAIIGRDTGFVFGDRVASLASFDTASVVGTKVAQVKSPGEVEIAAGERLNVTTAGTLDMAAGLVRVVAGYYPRPRHRRSILR